jgi:hypothetical protein
VDKGTYKGRRVEFEKYATSFFNPFLFSGSDTALMGCGACALALVTGIAPKTIAAQNGGVDYPDVFMTRFLRQHGLRVLKLTECNMSAAKDDIGAWHVVLLSQLFKRNEASWGIIFRGMYYHNFCIYALDSLSMLNKPVLSAYVILDPKWRIDPVEKLARSSALKKERLSLKSLRGLMRSASSISQPRIKE